MDRTPTGTADEMTAAALRAQVAATSDRYHVLDDLWKKGVPNVTVSDVLTARREAVAAILALEAALSSC